jgi:hypothetical protein
MEMAIKVTGLFLYLWRGPLRRGLEAGLVAFVLLVTVLTIAGMTVAPTPPPATAAALGPLATIGIVVAIDVWLDWVGAHRAGT